MIIYNGRLVHYIIFVEDKKMFRKSRVFLALTVLLALFLFVSCEKGNEENVNKPVTEQNGSVVEGDVFAERVAIDDELGDYDFGGKTLRFVGHGGDINIFLDTSKVNQGSLITDARFNTITSISDRFNVNFEVVYKSGINEVSEWVSKTVLSGVDEFDILSNHVLTTAGLVTKNLFLNWYDIPNVDFSKPWWAASTSEELSVNGKCVLAISDFNLSAITCTYCMVFNKNLANSYDLGNLYEVVNEGKWTFDYFTSLIDDIYIDTDGSGTKTSGDFYGILQLDRNHMNQWLWAFDNPIMKKDEEGVPAIALKTDKINNIVSTLYDYIYNTEGVYYEADFTDPSEMFLSKKTIFDIVVIGDFLGEGYRNFDDEYGVLPMPKWDETQKDYYTMAYGEHSVMAIPKTVKDTEFVGTVIEALSAESYKYVLPTLYEVALKTRYLRDNESKAMLDKILENRVFDFGYVYDGWHGFGYVLNDVMKSGNPNFESFYSGMYSKVRSHYKKMVKAIDKT